MDRGHSEERIATYSLAKFKGYLKAINDLENEELKEKAVAARIATAPKKDFEKFLKEK